MKRATKHKTHIAIIDDDSRYITNICDILGVVPEFRVVCAESRPVNALERLMTTTPDIVILDIAMPIKDGFTILRDIRNEPTLSRTKVLVYTIHADREYINQSVVDARANGYVVKGSAGELVEAIRRITDGEDDPYISAGSQSEFSIFNERLLSTVYAIKLNPRQEQVAQGLVRGLSYEDIGREIGVAQSTVKTHINKLRELFEYDRVNFGVDFKVILYLWLKKHGRLYDAVG